MTPGPWQVFSRVVDHTRLHAAGRLRDPDQPACDRNIEYAGGYIPNRAEAERRVTCLNETGHV
jgi:hypothetical protein